MSDLPDNMGKPLATTFIVCGVLIEQDGKYLLIQEKQKKAYKQWNIPCGKVDMDETLEQAAVREAKEESGYEVELDKHLLTLHVAADKPVLHVFSAQIVGGELDFPEDEILDANWFTREQLFSGEVDLRTPAYVQGAIEAYERADFGR